MLDIAIVGGKILDGSGKPSFEADIGISGGKIVEINKSHGPMKADRVIDASGQCVSPGFIDVHSHSDLSLLVDPLAQSKVRQGVTTEVNGNCGFGVAPIPSGNLHEFVNFWRSSGSEWFDITPSWETFAEYLKTLEERKPSINTTILAAHGTIRFVVMGDVPRRATDEEISKMERIVDECMSAGACGLSSGLRYVPGCYSDPTELISLCKVVGKYGGLYATHMRSEGDNGSWEDAIKESARIGKDAHVPLQISHLKALSKNVWNTSERALKLCDSLRKEGLDVTADQYPYDAAHTGLTVFLPKEVFVEELRTLDESKRKEVLQHISRVLDVRGGPTRIVIISSPGHRLDGKDILEISNELKIAQPEEAILKLIIELNGEISILSRSMLEEDIQRIMKNNFVMISTDGYSISPQGPSAVGIPHPRSYGTYPRILGHYVRELNVLTLEEAVRKMTSLPAARFCLLGRGLLEVGNYADIVVFDGDKIIDQSTFAEPSKYPKGIDYVLVNGEVVIDKTAGHTGRQAGKVLRLKDRQVT